MSLKYYRNLSEPTGSNSVSFGLAYSGNYYIITSQPRIRMYSQNTFENTKVSQNITSGAQGICLINSASAVLGHNSASVTYMELSSLHTTSVTSGAVSVPTGFGQVMAGNITNGEVIMGRTSSGGVIKATTAPALTALTPSALSGAVVNTVISKGSNWILGTNNGKIMEMDSSGTVSTNITVPTTPAISTPTPQIIGLSYYNDKLLALTDLGLMFLYTWSTSTLLDTQYVGYSIAGSSSSCLCDLGSGSVAMSCNPNGGSGGLLQEIYYESGKILIEDSLVLPNAPKSITYDPTTSFIGVNGSSSAFTTCSSAKVSKTDKIQVTTRLQDPAGLDIPGRVIRLRKAKVGSSVVENDTVTSTGPQTINATDSRSYLEIAVRSSPEKFDIREFDA